MCLYVLKTNNCFKFNLYMFCTFSFTVLKKWIVKHFFQRLHLFFHVQNKFKILETQSVPNILRLYGSFLHCYLWTYTYTLLFFTVFWWFRISTYNSSYFMFTRPWGYIFYHFVKKTRWYQDYIFMLECKQYNYLLV